MAQIQVLLDNTNITSKCPRLGNPYPSLRSWQWISCSLVLPSNGNNLTVMMSSSAAGTAYFDDLCVTFTRTETSMYIIYECYRIAPNFCGFLEQLEQ